MNPLLAGVLSSLFFVSLNVAMNIYTKWLFSQEGGNFALPWTMLSVQQVETLLILQPVLSAMRRRGWDKIGLDDQQEKKDVEWVHYFQVFVVTLLFCLNVGLNSLSLVEISITLNQTVRAFLPVGVLVLASFLEGRAYPAHSYFTTSVLVLGILVTCWGSPDFKLYGFSLAFASTVVAAGGTSLTGRLLSKGPFARSGPYGIANLLFIQSIPAVFIFSLIALLTEWQKVSAKLTGDDDGGRHWSPLGFLALVSVSSFLALLANLGRCFLVAATSALMETLAGNAKVAVLCCLDHLVFGTVLHVFNYIGITLTFLGFSVHVLLEAATRHEEPQNGEGSSEDQEELDAVPEMRQRLMSTVPRARLVSGLETGLAAEEMAGMLRRPAQKPTPAPVIPKPRSMTWPEVGPNHRNTSGGMLANVDLSLVFQTPEWLSAAPRKGALVEEYSPMTGDGLASCARARQQCVANRMSPVANSARTRFYTDPTDNNNNRSRLLQDVRQAPKVQAVEEDEEQEDVDPGLDYL